MFCSFNCTSILFYHVINRCYHHYDFVVASCHSHFHCSYCGCCFVVVIISVVLVVSNTFCSFVVAFVVVVIVFLISTPYPLFLPLSILFASCCCDLAPHHGIFIPRLSQKGLDWSVLTSFHHLCPLANKANTPVVLDVCEQFSSGQRSPFTN